MRRGFLLTAVAATALTTTLAACSEQAAEQTTADYSAAADAAQVETAPTAAESARSAPLSPTVAPPAAPEAPIARIAYAFAYTLSIPKDRGAELMSRHELTCAAAGPGYCQVITSRADWTGRDPGGRLELRGQPDWINRFRANLALDAQNAGGRLETSLTEGEDVTRALTTAETGARTTEQLAARVRELQARRGGTAAQRLEIERELAVLMRQLDEQRLSAQALNDRVQTARLTLDYRPGGVFASDHPLRPVAEALSGAFGLSMNVLGVLITLGALVLPIGAIAGAAWWAARRRRRKVVAA